VFVCWRAAVYGVIKNNKNNNNKPGGRLPLLFARPAVTLAILKRAATSFAAW